MFVLRNGILALIACVTFSSCLKEDKPIYPTVKETVQIPMGSYYTDQFYYDLATNTIVTSHARDSWDLAFESSANGYHVVLNSAKFMFANRVGSATFDGTYTYNEPARTWDVSSGNLDSTAIGEWGTLSDGNCISKDEVYIIDRGMDVNGMALGYKKLKLHDLVDNTYTVTFSDLDGTDKHTFQIKKDARYNFVYMTFDSGGTQLFPAPEKDAWDLRFSMYTKIFTESPEGGQPFEEGDTIPYLVNGVLLNPNGVAATSITSTAFDSLELGDAISAPLNYDLDAIGYKWKYYSLTASGYTVDTTMVYFIKDRTGDHYKLRFIDFYSNTGEKGYPTFEVRKLQ